MKLIYTFLITLSLFYLMSAHAQLRPIPNPLPRPIPIPISSSVCKRTCVDDMGQITFLTQNPDSTSTLCPDHPQQIYSCAPFSCDTQKKTCRSECTDNRDCAKGFTCDQTIKKCTTVSYFCAGELTLNGTDGTHRDCEPYSCQMGSCMGYCGAQTDCWPGYNCNSSSRCEKL